MSHRYHLRNRRVNHIPPVIPQRTLNIMANAQDALDAVAAVGNRIDAMEAGQTAMTLQLSTIATQLATLMGGQPLPIPPPLPGPAPPPSQRRRLDPSAMEKINGDVSTSHLRSWRNRWRDYVALNQLSTYPASEQMAALRMCLDPSMQQVVEVVLGISPTTHTTPDDVLDAISHYVRGKRNVALDRVAFEERRQGPAETVDDFYIGLRRPADSADLCGTCLDSRMTTRIMAGVRDSETKKKLLAISPFPTAQEAVNLCRSEESARANEKILSKQSGVSFIQHKKGPATDTTSCGSCGRPPHSDGKLCPAIGKTCHICGKANHYAPKCPNKQKSRPSGGSADSRSMGNGGTVGRTMDDTTPKSKMARIHIGNVQTSHHKRRTPIISVDIMSDDGTLMCTFPSVTPDPGAEVDCIALDILHPRYPLPLSSTRTLAPISALYTPDQPLLDNDFAFLHDTDIPADPSPEQANVVRETIVKHFQDVFDQSDGLRCMVGPEMMIHLRDDAIPYYVNGARPIPFAHRPEVRRLLDDLVRQGVIVPVSEPTEWAAPLVVIRNKNGKLRICIDHTRLNRFVQRPTHPTRTPKDAISEVDGAARFFSCFDAANGYFQIPLHPSCQHLTTFMTPWGRFKFLRASMGLSCSGDEYNRRADMAFAGLSNTVRVVDDLLRFDSEFPEHVRGVCSVLQAARQAGITLNLSKFRFAQAKISWVGYEVQHGGCTADPEKLCAISRFPRPGNITELRSFMGLVEQLAGFSSAVATAKGPLRPLLSSRNPYIWTTDHEKAFSTSKRLFSSLPYWPISTPTGKHRCR